MYVKYLFLYINSFPFQRKKESNLSSVISVCVVVMFHPRGTVHESHVLEGVQKENLIQDRSAPLGQTDRWWIRLWQLMLPLRGVFVLFLLRLKDSLIDLSCFPPFPFLSSNEIQGILGLVLDSQWINKLFRRTNWLILSNHASSLPQICELWRYCALLGLHTCLSLCALASLQTWCWDAFLLKVCAYIDLFVWLLDVLFVKDWYLHLFLSSLGVFLILCTFSSHN